MKQADISDAVGDETVNYYYYLSLIKAKERIRAFQAALRSSVRNGDVVVEIGFRTRAPIPSLRRNPARHACTVSKRKE